MCFVAAVLLCGAVLLVLALLFPRYTASDDAALRRAYAAVRHVGSASSQHQLAVLSFNLRYECEENNADNHWSQRLPRIVRLINELRPTVLGLQEVDQMGEGHPSRTGPPGTQLSDLLAALPPRYRLATQRPAPPAMAETPVQLYDSEQAELLEQDYLWLSDTPRTPSSVAWGSSRPRVLNVARLRLRTGKPGAAEPEEAKHHDGLEFIAFNTHLDVRRESARRGQVALIRTTIVEWQQRHPHAAVVVTGDFNTFPGQAAHRTMTSGLGGLQDSWDACAAAQGNTSCVQGGPAQSFHGYLGAALLHSFLGRVAVGTLGTLHGMGVTFNAGSFSRGPVQAALALGSPMADVFHPPYALRDALPSWPWSRLHVDWILFAQPSSSGVPSSGRDVLRPVFVGVLDARQSNFSSDHFPLAAIFDVQRVHS
jgi:endonuclease/exonuclease/phosphatase family metal-dependent hydrolase